ncbi:MAG TPA: hypothetical protein PKC85_00040 [Bacteroidia bacterium]|nr:hypothetical protein [Bacteroidia bacterium]HMU18207.1 hypothetical protein [Bacteroidia bacterium]
MMRIWGLKLLVLIWVVFTGYWLLPLKKPKAYREDSEPNTILATQQFCEPQSADIIIKRGELIIPDSLKKMYPELRKDVALIVGSSPFKKSKSALMFSYDFVMSGHVERVGFTQQEGYVPVFHVEEWFPTQYIARFWKLTHNSELLYLINLNIGLPLLLFYFFKQGSSLNKFF